MLLVQLRCDARACAAETRPYGSEMDAITEARQCWWIASTVATRTLWFCPLHQWFDPRLQRWVPAPAARLRA